MPSGYAAPGVGSTRLLIGLKRFAVGESRSTERAVWSAVGADEAGEEGYSPPRTPAPPETLPRSGIIKERDDDNGKSVAPC